MDRDYLKKKLDGMNAVLHNLEQGLYRLDLLGLEIVSIKAEYRVQIKCLKNAVCLIVQMLNDDTNTNFQREYIEGGSNDNSGTD